MKNLVRLFTAIFIGYLTSSLLLADVPAEVKNALTKGARAKITFRVVDSKGNPVEKANVLLGFWNPNNERDPGVKGVTDANGLFTATGNPVNEVNYQFTKDGYYRTQDKYVFDPNTVKDGRWQPWNPTNTVVLKEKRHPVPMLAMSVDTPIPVWGIPVGFDFEKGNWIAPYGKGIKADVYFEYKANIKDLWTGAYEFTITSSNTLDGFCREKKDSWSEFGSTYEAPTNGYTAKVVQVLDRTRDKILKQEKFGDTEYVALRMRAETNGQGDIVSARYGKIYGPIQFGVGREHHTRFKYYFNPDGTRNLEFDPKSNLFTNLPSSFEVDKP